MFAIKPVSPEKFTPDRFKGDTMLITGAATGIGAATAIRAAREGAKRLYRESAGWFGHRG